MVNSLYDLSERAFVITGGAGRLGRRHCQALGAMGARVVVLDLHQEPIADAIAMLKREGITALGYECDITSETQLLSVRQRVMDAFGRIDGLVNNAANNPITSGNAGDSKTQLETFSLDQWTKDLEVGVTGAMLCSRVFGSCMADKGRGVIVNISSDLGIIAPDQRIYHQDGKTKELQVVKPVSYSVVKHAIIGLTKWLATYWGTAGVRVNALCPGGVRQHAPSEELVRRVSERVPMGRMANEDEYQGALQFLCSDASSYMTGATLVVDGGRTIW